jgi:hypothetical protein
MKKREKKLQLNRETVATLQQVVGGALVRQEGEVASAGPVICYISDCNPCEGTVYAPMLPIKSGEISF